jgi:SAM-dependent methyltransferase
MPAALSATDAAFPARNAPRAAFGAWRSEACIEAPWASQHLAGRARILDIGFTLASLDHLGVLLGLAARGSRIEAVDAIPPDRVAGRFPDAWREAALAVPVHVGDLETLDLPAGGFDAVACISALEHLGFEGETRPADASARILSQAAKLVAPGGVLVVTVPMGAGGARRLVDDAAPWSATIWEHSPDDWRAMLAASGLAVREQRFFEWLGETEGWRETGAADDLSGVSCAGLCHAAGVAVAVLDRPA